ncbi:cation diffusion facilitator family transporter [Desulforhopalus vacuolatus]|uniref:cation diffusion facilitator family transporter n=1 Tax=Desulforhopalus vacuolatus TaxID=40414 RepID=UPI001962C4A1|nr:cation diffusion facilitator family transporter [Desulforhopalus vacuolatus]MBM9519099.1 cation diffusion facilitator family transporter [Desulforhopalus vacuolatus]
MKNNSKIEQKALIFSMLSIVAFVFLSLGFALFTRSESILFDGIYSLISFSIVFLTLKVSQLAVKPDDDAFHFGYTQFEPLINVFKSVFIITACIYAVFGAVKTIVNGGNHIDMGAPIIYAAIAAVGSFFIAFYLWKKAKKCRSGLLKVEAMEWGVDAMLSLGLFLGFTIALFLQQGPWNYLVPYVDPVMLIVIAIIAVPIPLKILFSNMREVLYMAPPEPFLNELEKQLDDATKDIPLNDYEFRVVKHGRNTFVLVHLMVSDDFHFNTVADLDRIREKIETRILAFNPEIVMEILFIKDKVWAELR